MRVLRVATTRGREDKIHLVTELVIVGRFAARASGLASGPCRVKGASVERSPERPVLTVAQVYALADAVSHTGNGLVAEAGANLRTRPDAGRCLMPWHACGTAGRSLALTLHGPRSSCALIWDFVGAPSATRTRDLLLRRSFRGTPPPATVQVRSPVVGVSVPLNDRRSRPVLARIWHVHPSARHPHIACGAS